MKISKEKIQKIIKEELEMVYSGPKMAPKTSNFDHDQEGEMAKNQLKKIAEYALGLYSVLDDNQELESWVQSKITLADDYISKVKHYLENELQLDIPEPDLDSAIESCNKEPEQQENNNYAGQGSYYYEI
jgi:serine protease inhibitor